MGMRSYLKAHNLEDKRDFSVVEIDFANQWPALTSNKSDLAFMTIPFSIPVLVANAIAWPLAWFYLHNWLEGYAYRISLNPAYFLAAGMAALLMMLTVALQIFRWYLLVRALDLQFTLRNAYRLGLVFQQGTGVGVIAHGHTPGEQGPPLGKVLVEQRLAVGLQGPLKKFVPGLDVALHQKRRGVQRVADIIEAIGG